MDHNVSNRTETYKIVTIVVEGISSSRSDVISGLPQGTLLGPILFFMHIGDINSELRYATALFFADDTYLFAIREKMSRLVPYQIRITEKIT